MCEGVITKIKNNIKLLNNKIIIKILYIYNFIIIYINIIKLNIKNKRYQLNKMKMFKLINNFVTYSDSITTRL